MKYFFRDVIFITLLFLPFFSHAGSNSDVDFKVFKSPFLRDLIYERDPPSPNLLSPERAEELYGDKSSVLYKASEVIYERARIEMEGTDEEKEGVRKIEEGVGTGNPDKRSSLPDEGADGLKDVQKTVECETSKGPCKKMDKPKKFSQIKDKLSGKNNWIRTQPGQKPLANKSFVQKGKIVNEEEGDKYKVYADLKDMRIQRGPKRVCS